MIDYAKLIICIIENEHCHCEEDLRSALANAEEACCQVHDAEDQMEQADMHIISSIKVVLEPSCNPLVKRPNHLCLGFEVYLLFLLVAFLTQHPLVDE